MTRTYQDVPKRARNSINIQINKLVKKYGEKSVRLVVMKFFERASDERKLTEEIRKKENELNNLRRKKK